VQERARKTQWRTLGIKGLETFALQDVISPKEFQSITSSGNHFTLERIVTTEQR
jgi:hypothetical protein